MAVDREFYVYRFGWPRTGRTGGRAEGGRADGGRTGGRTAGTILNDSTPIFIDFHKKTTNNNVFLCRFASGGSASTNFYSSNEKGVQKTSKNNVFCDFSNHAGAQVPIFTPKMKKSGSPA